MKNIWAIVTARRNSKSIKRKNIVKLGNKKIIEYSFDVLDKIRKKRQIQKIIVSSDDEIIKKLSKKFNFEYHKRIKKLSGDRVNSVDVVKDVLNTAKNSGYKLPEYFLLIQPTSVFIQKEHLNKIINKLKTNKFKSAQTIIKVPHQFHAYNQRELFNTKVKFLFEKKRMLMHNKQTKPSFYSYGNLIASNTNKFLKESNFFIKPSFGLLIKNIYGFELDNIFDLKVAQQLVKKKINYYE